MRRPVNCCIHGAFLLMDRKNRRREGVHVVIQLSRPTSSDLPLLVVALHEEAKALGDDLPVLITGLGKINVAISLTETLASSTSMPASIVNLGTAGALQDGRSGIQVVREVIEHDFDTELLASLTGEFFRGPLTLTDADGVTLATGDTFVSDTGTRAKLASHADLVDMEGYAVAAVAAEFGIPARVIKHVSNEANESATTAWRDSVASSAACLAAWVISNLT
jgi:adenosylhomocysteine nucleosidase